MKSSLKKNNNKLATIISTIQVVISIIVGFAYTPLLIKYLGDNEYGLYQTITSAISILSLLNLGLNSSYIKFFSIYNKEHDNRKIYQLNGIFLVIFFLIGIVVLVCGVTISNHLELIFEKGLSQEEYSIAYYLMLISSFSLAASFPLSVFGMIISAYEKFIYLKFLAVINTIIGPSIMLPLLMMGYRSKTMVIVGLFVTLLNGALNLYYVLNVLKVKFIFRGLSKKVVISIFGFSKYIAVSLLVDQINWNIDKLLLGRFKGTASVAIYTVGYTFFTYYLLMSISISEIFIPYVHKLVNQTKDDVANQRKLLTEIFIKVGRTQFVVLGLIFSGFIFFGRFFICSFWLNEKYADSYYVAVLLMLSSSFALIQNIGIEIQRAQNKHKFRSWLYLIMAFINFIISIFLVNKYGALGATIGTAISLLLANGLLMNIYYYKHCNIDITAFWKSIMGIAKGLIIPILVGLLYKWIFRNDNKIYFVLWMLVYVFIYIFSMYFVGFNFEEKENINTFLRKVFKKNIGDNNGHNN